jgi:hypothetical protein
MWCEVLITVKMWMMVFWVMTLCSLVSGYHCFGGRYCLPEDGGDMCPQNVGNHLLEARHHNPEKFCAVCLKVVPIRKSYECVEHL